MNPTLIKTGLRDSLRRPWLTALLVLSVAIGVAVVVAIDMANESASRAFNLSTAAVVGRATHEIVGGYVRSVARSARLRAWIWLGLGVLPAIVGFLAYNALRFGSPWESGYGLATLPGFLEAQRLQGLFSPAHVPMNLDYFLIHLPTVIPTFPFFRPDGLGLSVFITSPGLLFATQADWRRPRSRWLAGAVIAVLVPTLLYYGGGWLQFGYRYFLDSVPFVIALCGLAAVHRGKVGPGWMALIAIGTVVMAFGVYWAPRNHWPNGLLGIRNGPATRTAVDGSPAAAIGTQLRL